LFGKAHKQEIAPSDSMSQIGDESSAAGSLDALRKRESKAATKSPDAQSEISSKTFGGEMGKPGTQFEMNGVKFTVTEKKQGKNRIV
jgi:hypothetical protein